MRSPHGEPSPGLVQLNTETARQFQDSLNSYNNTQDMGAVAATHIRDRGRLLLLGMGGSHWANRMVVPAYRAAGIDANAEVLSEYMRAPHAKASALIVTSQSGASGEVIRFIDKFSEARDAIGLTINKKSALGQLHKALVGHGGAERAYAATRSLIITLALHARILNGLGVDTAPFIATLNSYDVLNTPAAVDIIAAAPFTVFSSRGALQGVAEAAALSLMELARRPVLALEAGQFRHGPLELVKEDTGVVFIRGKGAEGDGIDELATACLEAGARPIILDLTGRAPVHGCLHIDLPHTHGLCAVVISLTTLQRIVIDAAELMVDNMGAPLRSSKVTSGEGGA